MKILLKPYNIDVTVAQSLEEMGNKLSDDETFDMIIIDDIIPNFEIDSFTKEIIKDQNGILNYIKKQARYNITTIIMVTPNNKRIEEQYIKYGFNAYIIKPVNKENIDKVLNKYFKTKEWVKQLILFLFTKNRNELSTYYNVGKLLIEAQGGEDRAKYGDNLIKEYSERLTKELGKGYSTRNLKNMRKFYLLSEKGQPVAVQFNFVSLLTKVF